MNPAAPSFAERADVRTGRASPPQATPLRSTLLRLQRDASSRSAKFDPVNPLSMKCLLCQREATLRASHIVPEFFYRPMYDDKHRFLTVSSDPERKDRMSQKGLRESLLCDECEGRLARWEKYFSELLNGGDPVEMGDDGRHLLLRTLDYTKLKLMLLSVLWRMSVTRLPFFQAVDLGPHEEKVRQMLLADDPGPAELYGVMAVAPYFDGKYLGDLITPPDIARIHANRIYRCVLGGILFLYFVPGRLLPAELLPFLPSPAGTWRVRRERVESIEFLFRHVLELGRGINERKG